MNPVTSNRPDFHASGTGCPRAHPQPGTRCAAMSTLRSRSTAPIPCAVLCPGFAPLAPCRIPRWIEPAPDPQPVHAAPIRDRMRTGRSARCSRFGYASALPASGKARSRSTRICFHCRARSASSPARIPISICSLATGVIKYKIPGPTNHKEARAARTNGKRDVPISPQRALRRCTARALRI